MKVLFLSSVWPEPTSSAAGVRVLSLAKSFMKRGAQIYWGATCKPSSFQEDLEKLGIRTREILLNDSSFNDWVKDVAPDGVVFERFVVEEQFSFRVREVAPRAWMACDTSDLHSIRRAREAWVRKNLADSASLDLREIRNPKSMAVEWLWNDDTFRELSSIHRMDLNWVVSFEEARWLVDFFGVAPEKVFVLPIDLGLDRVERQVERSERSEHACIGNFRHSPNLDAVRFLKSHLWPAVRAKLPHAKISIYGAYPSKEAMGWNSPQTGFSVRGPAEDSRVTLSKAISLVAPLRFGAGVKGKILDSWSVGTPVVTTEIGAEGILPIGQATACELPGFSIDDWVNAIVRLEADSQHWKGVSDRGIAAFNAVYSSQPVDAFFESSFRRLSSLGSSSIKKGSESGQWTQALLWSNQLRSTEYFSRWIEEKNRKKGP